MIDEKVTDLDPYSGINPLNSGLNNEYTFNIVNSIWMLFIGYSFVLLFN